MVFLQSTRLIYPFILSFSLVACGEAGFSPEPEPDSKELSQNPNAQPLMEVMSLDVKLSSKVISIDQSVDIEVIAKDVNNNLIKDAVIDFSVDNNATLEVKGKNRATLTIVQAGLGSLALTIRSGLVEKKVIIPVIQKVSSISLIADARQILSDGSKPVTITAIAKDSKNNAIEDEGLEFSVDHGAILEVSGNQAVLKPGNELADKLTVVVISKENPLVRQNLVFDMVKVEDTADKVVSNIDLVADSTFIYADASKPVKITAVAKNKDGNAIPDTVIQFTTDKTVATLQNVKAGSVDLLPKMPYKGVTTLVVTAKVGNKTETIGIPVVSRLESFHLVASQDRLFVDSRDGVVITPTAIDREGLPVRFTDAGYIFKADNGAVISVQAGKAILKTGTAKSGIVTVTVSAQGIERQMTFKVIPKVVSISLSSTIPQLLTNGKNAPAEITALAKDKNNNVIDDAAFVFSVDHGAIIRVLGDNKIALEPGNEVADTLTVTASSKENPAVIQAIKIGLVEAENDGVDQVVSKIDLIADADAIYSDGSRVKLTAVAKNKDGNVIPGTVVKFSVDESRATLSNIVKNTAELSAKVNGGNIRVTVKAGGKTETLMLPVVSRLASFHLSLDQDRLYTDGSNTVTITPTATDKYGKPVSFADAGFVFKADNGARVVVKGEKAILEIGDAKSGMINVTASAQGITQTASIKVVQKISSISLSSNLTQLLSDGSNAPAIVTAVAKDSKNNAIEGAELEFEVDNGAILKMLNNNQVSIEPGSVKAGSLTVTVNAKENPAIRETVSIDLVYIDQTVNSVDLTAPAKTIFSDGTPIKLTAIVKNKNGNEILGSIVMFSVDETVATLTHVTANTADLIAKVGSGKTITVSVNVNGKTDRITLNVINKVGSFHLSADQDRLYADGSNEITITPTAIDKDGKPVSFEDAGYVFKADNGAKITIRNGKAILTIGDAKPGTVKVTVTSQGATQTLPIKVVQKVASLSLSSSLNQLFSTGSNGPAIITAVAKDNKNNIIKDAELEFSVDHGAIIKVLGANQISLEPGNEETSSLTVVVTSKENPAIKRTLTVAVVPVEDGDIDKVVSAVELVSETGKDIISVNDTVKVTAVAKNKDGQVIPGTVVEFTTDLTKASLSNLTANTVDVHSKLASGELITLNAKAGGKTGSLTLRVVDRVESFHLVASDNRLYSDGSNEITITPSAKDSEGKSVSFVDAGYIFKADNGADITLQGEKAILKVGDASFGTVTVTVTSLGDITRTMTFEVVQVPKFIELETSSNTILADGSEPVTITATIKDAKNNILQNVPIEFTVKGINHVTNQEDLSFGTLNVLADGKTVQLSPGGATFNDTLIVMASVILKTPQGESSITKEVRVKVSKVDGRPSSIEFNASSRQLFSSGVNPVVLSAIVKDGNNNALSDQDVLFVVDNGAVITPLDGSGSVKMANLEPGSKENRILKVTAIAGDIYSQDIQVEVIGTKLKADGPETLILNTPATYSFKLLDSDNNPIAFEDVLLSSDKGEVTPARGQTNSNGEIEVNFRSAQSGEVALTATALGATTTKIVKVSADNFSFISSPVQDIAVNTPSDPFKVQWLQGGTPQVGKAIHILSTRGELLDENNNPLVSSEIITGTDGTAQFRIQSGTAGFAIITAETVEGQLITTLKKEFIATQPNYLDIQASPALIAPGEASSIITRIRDINNNPVKNQKVNFALSDVVNGQLNQTLATTDSDGRARVTYTAGDNSSGLDGVTIEAMLQDNPGINNAVSLTVGGQALRIVLGEDEKIGEDGIFYTKQYGILVTDSHGNPVKKQSVQFSIHATEYYKGKMELVDTDNDAKPDTWLASYLATCLSEDADADGQLDAAEDINGNGKLDPTQAAAVTGNGITDDDGKLVVSIRYPQSEAVWSKQRLTVTAKVAGTEQVENVEFILPMSATDAKAVDVSPPNAISPYGKSNNCSNSG